MHWKSYKFLVSSTIAATPSLPAAMTGMYGGDSELAEGNKTLSKLSFIKTIYEKSRWPFTLLDQ